MNTTDKAAADAYAAEKRAEGLDVVVVGDKTFEVMVAYTEPEPPPPETGEA